MINNIDYERRITAEEHYYLYIYYTMITPNPEKYNDFNLTEELITKFNCLSDAQKEVIEHYRDSNLEVFSQFIRAFNEFPWLYEKPVLWADRKKTNYYIQQLKKSHSFEVYIDYLFRSKGVDIGLYYGRNQQYHQGETVAGIEIKYDIKSTETGNYYIEYQERMTKNGSWINSGILKNDKTRFYLLGTIKGFVIFERSWLLDYYYRLVIRKEFVQGARLVHEKEHGTSKGFILYPELSMEGNIPFDEIIEILRQE